MERVQTLATAGVPYPNGFVGRRRRKPGRVVGEGYCPYPVGVALERLETLTTTGIPYPDGFVVRR